MKLSEGIDEYPIHRVNQMGRNPGVPFLPYISFNICMLKCI